MFKLIRGAAKLAILLVSTYVLYVAFDAITNSPHVQLAEKTPLPENTPLEIMPRAQKKPSQKNATLESKLKDCLGKSNLDHQERLRGISRKQNTLAVSITIDDNLTSNMIEGGWQDDAWKIFQIAYEDRRTRTDVMVVGLFPVTDAYGNTRTKIIGAILLPKTEYQKINKDNFYPEDLWKIAEYRFDFSGLK